jgi:hypothetical protein
MADNPKNNKSIEKSHIVHITMKETWFKAGPY